MHTATAHTFDNCAISHFYFHDEIDLDADIFYRLSLGDGARKTIQQKTVLTVGFLDAFFHQTNNNAIRD